MKLYQGDTLIRENEFSSDMQFVEVPSGTLPYHLVLDASRPADVWRLSTRTHTEWDFVSGTTSGDNFDPLALLELDYHLETDLRGDVKSGSTQQIRLTAGPQAGGGPAVGTVTSGTLEVSYDDGATWQKVTLKKQGDGQWKGDLKLPKQPGGFVSVRASAETDAAGASARRSSGRTACDEPRSTSPGEATPRGSPTPFPICPPRGYHPRGGWPKGGSGRCSMRWG